MKTEKLYLLRAMGIAGEHYPAGKIVDVRTDNGDAKFLTDSKSALKVGSKEYEEHLEQEEKRKKEAEKAAKKDK